MRVLMELRPALEGFAGIPQETRLLFLNLHEPGEVDVDGLLNTFHNTYRPRHSAKPAAQMIYEQARYVLSVSERWQQGRFARSRALPRHASMALKAALGIPGKIRPFNAKLFRDFVWQSVFAKSLEPNVFNDVLARPYYMTSDGWDAMHRVGGLTGIYPRLDTSPWDVVLMQTPFPARVSANTTLVVRYHDAIPVYLPQHISNARNHMWAHFHGLKMNSKRAWFVCTSLPVLHDLLGLFPEVEARATVIPDMVSDVYYPDRCPPEEVRALIRNYVAQESALTFITREPEVAFYEQAFSGDYVMAVGTIEPRKNYRLLMSAWERFNLSSGHNVQLIIVGEMGWNYEQDHRQIEIWSKRGGLFHLARMPVWALRKLYSNALAVVCPSVSEGFDFSGIEAMRCDTPVIASDIPTHRAVYGDAARYFSPYSTADLVSQLEAATAKRDNSRVKKGRAVVAQYAVETVVPLWHSFFERVQREKKSL